LINNGSLPLEVGTVRVTYHDPCYLGRHNREYEAPRQILSAIPGLELLEMERNREDAFCCGGGGGNFFTDLIGGGTRSPARIRIREAMNTGAGVIATACPQCAKMLDDALKAEGLEEKMEVKDIAEIISEYC
jgi:Fe-S oxidoreductase